MPRPRLNVGLLLLCAALALSAAAGVAAEEDHVDTRLVDSDNIKDLATATCLQYDLQIWCRLINMYKTDPTIAKLFDGTSQMTFFGPTDRGIHNVSPRFPAEMGTTLGRMLDGLDPTITTSWIRAHMVTNEPPIVYSAWYENNVGKVWTNNVGQTLTVVEGTGREVPPGSRRQYFVQGPKNIIRAGWKSRWDIIGGQSLLQVVEVPLIY